MVSFTRMKYTPENGLRDRARFRTAPENEEEARSQFQDMFDQIKEYINSVLIEELGAAGTGSSGAERIGSAAINNLAEQGVSPVTVRGQIELLNRKFDDAVSGSISVSEVIGDGTLNGSKLTDGAVTTQKIADGAVTAAKLAGGTLSADALTDGSITAPKIQNGAVTGAKLAAGAVTEEKIGEGAVTNTKIMNAQITSQKLAAGAVTADKLGTIGAITMASGDTLSYDNENDVLKLCVSGCAPVQLIPVVFGTSDSPPQGTYPKGTLYIQYEA